MIALLDGYSKANVGDWLLLENSSQFAEDAFAGEVQLALAMDPASFEGHLTRARVVPSPVEPERMLPSLVGAALALVTAGRAGPAHLRALRQARVAFSIGGGFLQMRSLRELATVSLIHLSQMAICRGAGRPLVMLPQSVGPFHGRVQRALARRVLGWFTMLLVREERSAQHLRELDPRLDAKVRVVPDLAFLSTRRERPAPPAGGDGLRVGIVVRQWWFPRAADPAAAQERYLAEMARFADRLAAAGHTPVLVVHSDGPTNRGDDRISTARVRELSVSRPEIVDVAGLPRIDDVIATYAGFDAVASTRLHGALLTLIAGVPAIAIGYEWKSEGIYDELGLQPWHVTMEDVTAGWLEDRVAQLATYPLISAWEAMVTRRDALELLSRRVAEAVA